MLIINRINYINFLQREKYSNNIDFTKTIVNFYQIRNKVLKFLNNFTEKFVKFSISWKERNLPKCKLNFAEILENLLCSENILKFKNITINTTIYTQVFMKFLRKSTPKIVI